MCFVSQSKKQKDLIYSYITKKKRGKTSRLRGIEIAGDRFWVVTVFIPLELEGLIVMSSQILVASRHIAVWHMRRGSHDRADGFKTYWRFFVTLIHPVVMRLAVSLQQGDEPLQQYLHSSGVE